ncbi:MAG: hypothetical protein ACRDHF_07650 [Tepidiformaceae bacterium]
MYFLDPEAEVAVARQRIESLHNSAMNLRIGSKPVKRRGAQGPVAVIDAAIVRLSEGSKRRQAERAGRTERSLS